MNGSDAGWFLHTGHETERRTETDGDREKTGSGERSEQEGREHFGLVCCCGRRIFITSPEILVDKRCSEINWNKRVRIYILYLWAFQ